MHPLVGVQIHFRKAGAGVLRSVAKHTPELAKCVVESGAPEMLTVLLEDFNAGVREASAGAISAICSQGEGASLPSGSTCTRHELLLFWWCDDTDEAHSLVDAGCVPLLVVCLQEPDVALKRACASALAEIAGHSVEVSRVVVSGVLPCLIVKAIGLDCVSVSVLFSIVGLFPALLSRCVHFD